MPCLTEIVPTRRSLFLVMIASAALVSLTPSSPAQRLIVRNTLISQIATASEFAFGGVGFVMTISKSEMAYRELVSYPPSAAADFERVFAEGNPQGKAYALVGLRQTNPKRFEELAASLRMSTTLVQTQEGCVVGEVQMRELVNDIRAGLYSGPMTRNPVSHP